MPISKFKFVSPGIFLQEVDLSGRPPTPAAVGPAIIGRTRRGPALRPVQVESFVDFIEIFGNPVASSEGGDIWRYGNDTSAPTYASFAAQAWLRNNSPATIVRLAGGQHEDATTAGKAGWQTVAAAGTTTVADFGGAQGLFIWQSGSSVGTYPTGTLAAVWYLDEGAVLLSGAHMHREDEHTASMGVLLRAVDNHGTGGTWRVIIKDSSETTIKSSTFNFNRNSPQFIRKVFNTDPTKTNSSVTSDTVNYWLGETYETTASSMNSTILAGAILSLKGASADGGKFRKGVTPSATGWVLSQDVSADTGSFDLTTEQKLFKFHSLPAGGTWEQNNLKVSIQDIQYSSNEDVEPYGTFTVVLRKLKDSDNLPVFVERFRNCNLNPNSPNFIARKIGDKQVTWSDTQRRYRELGTYENRSKFIRVELNSDVEVGSTNPALLPFGFEGPDRYKTLGPGMTNIKANHPGGFPSNAFVTAGTASIPGVFCTHTSSYLVALGTHGSTGGSDAKGLFDKPNLPIKFPSLVDFLRVSASHGNLGDKKDAYFGVNSQQGACVGGGGAGTSMNFDESYLDLVRAFPVDVATAELEKSFYFSLDDVIITTTANDKDARVFYLSGSRRAGTSATATGSNGYKDLLDLEYDRFTMPLVGGFDGTDITEKDPFNMRSGVMGSADTTSYVYNSWKRAIDSVADTEAVEINALVAPGLTTTSLTDHMVDVCEARRDALAIIDLEGGYVPRSQNTDSVSTRKGEVDTIISNIKARSINSSYACSYYPWVQILDSLSSGIVWVPPSVVALGTFASSDRASAVWFAPAGFVRGGLSEGASGLTVVNVDGKLTSKERDKLYTENINPIASFPAEGIVIFGQKTMQVKPSALDRINVRRLLIYIKKGVSRIAATTLFENSIPSTWNGFSGRTERFLDSIKTGGGLTDFKVVLDETTTTPDLVDRNILYAKVFLKPARAIEFIAVDFIITRSGASFED